MALGQSEVVVDGKSYRLSKEDAKVERLVRRAFEAKAKADSAAEEFNGLKKELVAIAAERRGKSNTVGLGWIDLVAKVRFTQSIGFDSQALTILKGKMEPEAFERLFTERLSFTAKKGLELWMKEPGHQAASAEISRAMTVTDVAPKISFESITSAE